MGQAPSEPIAPEVALKLRKMIDMHLLPLMMILYWVQFMDKTTLGNSAILGIRADTHLNANHNWLGTIFYIAYLVFEYPQNLALQRFPVGKWMSINITCWGIALSRRVQELWWPHSMSNYSGYMRGFNYGRQSLRVGYWCKSISVFLKTGTETGVVLMNGTAQIISGFLSFGVLHIETHGFAPWQWFFLPLIKVNQTGVITINSFGFSTLQTTLLACVDGVVETITIYTGVLLASKWKDGRGYVAALYFVPNILGSVSTMSNQIGPLFSLWITGVGTTRFVLSLGWMTAVVAGHNKGITAQAIMLSAYCVGNLVGPQMWQERYKPGDHNMLRTVPSNPPYPALPPCPRKQKTRRRTQRGGERRRIHRASPRRRDTG
ncbi:hypothetical protein RSAG8_10233, partial [Rhizoctonia solani AG-8 WAC10335]